MTNLGKNIPLLCCDVSHDGLTVVAGSDLQGDDASIFFWCVFLLVAMAIHTISVQGSTPARNSTTHPCFDSFG